MSPGESDTRTTPNAKRLMPPERLAPQILAHREAFPSHPEVQETYEAFLSFLEGVAAGARLLRRTARLLRHQAMRFADAPAAARLYRQAASDLERLQCEDHQAHP